MMYCPKCNSENSDSAKFCKKCGTPLQNRTVSHEKMMANINKEKSGDNTTKIIIIALIVVAVVLAGAFVYIYGFQTITSKMTAVRILTQMTTIK